MGALGAAGGGLTPIMDQLPQHAFSGAIALETDDPCQTMLVKPLDGFMQSMFGVLLILRWQGVVDSLWPALLFEGRQDGLLVGSWNTKTFHHLSADN
jgi:hypothetical protein